MNFPERATVVRETTKNATRIRKAFDAAIDGTAIAKAWIETHPAGEPVSPQMARDWTLAHARTKKQPLEIALSRLYADGYTLGSRVAKGRVLRMVVKGATAGVIDWTRWTPGMESAAALVKPTGGLEQLLRTRKISITDDILRTKLDRIGTSLSASLARGEDAFETARGINAIVNDPQHALMIARTEMARSMSVASRDVYEQNDVQQVEWLVAEGCEDCQENADASPIGIDETFPSGDYEPPAHPNCECAIAPYFDDSDLPALEEVPETFDIDGQEIEVVETSGDEAVEQAEVVEPLSPSSDMRSKPIDAFAAQRNAKIEETSESMFDFLRTRASNTRGGSLTEFSAKAIAKLPKKIRPDLTEQEMDAVQYVLRSDTLYSTWITGQKKALVAAGYAPRTAETQVDIEVGRVRAYVKNLEKQAYERAKADRFKTSNDATDAEWYAIYKKNKAIGEAKLAEALATGQPTIAVPPAILQDVFAAGRFKNQFETATSRGTLSKPIRIDGEGIHLNIDANVPGKQRPIYGFLSTGNRPQADVSYLDGVAPMWDQLLNANGKQVNQYGEVRIILKPNMRSRATVTLDDSLGSGQLADKLNSKNHDLVQLQAETKMYPADNQGIPQTRYIELQYDKVTVDDFAEILVPDYMLDAVKKQVKELNLDIKVTSREAHKAWGE